MPRTIIEDRKGGGSRLLLVHDPHDFSTKDRWFVESQLRFDNEADARALFNLIDAHVRYESEQ